MLSDSTILKHIARQPKRSAGFKQLVRELGLHGNARGELDAWPGGWDALPKHRIGHCHCKDAVKTDTPAGFEWRPVGGGIIDWAAQFKAFKKMGYSHAVSLETHWHGGGTPEQSTRTSMAGLKKALAAADV